MSGFPCRPYRSQVAGLLLLVHLAGCSSWHHNPNGVEALLQEKNPQRVRVTLAGGKQGTFESPRIEGDSLIGFNYQGKKPERLSVATTDVREAAVHNFDTGKTVLLVAGVGLTLILVAAAAASASDFGGGGGGGGDCCVSC